MKKVYLIGFRGTGFQNSAYANEPVLIRSGHVGFSFEGIRENILGFHPAQDVIDSAGGDEIVIEKLKNGENFDGILQADRAIFTRAAELVKHGLRTTVWQIAIELSDEDFERVQRQTLQWYTEKKRFTYAFPARTGIPSGEQDNCATFPRRLGLTLPESSGQLVKFIAALENAGERWKPDDR
ncbi:MAG: hypothetical protein ABI700_26155 [Chloroflexota bacterium]